MIRGTNTGSSRIDTKDEARYVVFRLGTEKFGARIEQVKEVLTVDHITPIPRAPYYVLGVLNLRGVVCTVINLARRLTVRRSDDAAPNEIDNRTVVIVEIGKSILGMAVDHVESITSIPFSIIETQLDMVKKEIHAPFLEGIAKMAEDELIILLNLDVVFSEYEVEELVDMAERKAERDTELDGEFVVSKEELERLDLAYDDIDEISAKSKAKAAKAVSAEPEPIETLSPEEKKEDSLPELSKSDLEKKTKDELAKLVEKLGIKNVKAKKKAELVDLLIQPSKEK
ncbi:MAG: chemotaxis protein CheW [Candidatus Thorarchaeota archaeon]